MDCRCVAARLAITSNDQSKDYLEPSQNRMMIEWSENLTHKPQVSTASVPKAGIFTFLETLWDSPVRHVKRCHQYASGSHTG